MKDLIVIVTLEVPVGLGVVAHGLAVLEEEDAEQRRNSERVYHDHHDRESTYGVAGMGLAADRVIGAEQEIAVVEALTGENLEEGCGSYGKHEVWPHPSS